jgi:hypothetical protein
VSLLSLPSSLTEAEGGEEEGYGKEPDPDSDLDEEEAEQKGDRWASRRSGRRQSGWRRVSSLKEKQAIGLFGSLLTTAAPYYVNGPASLSSALNATYQRDKQLLSSAHPSTVSSKSLLLDGEESGDNEVTTSFLTALAPMRDRYLTAALNKMNEPVLQVWLSPFPHLPTLSLSLAALVFVCHFQMFSESEGYSAAVPSRRDLQTLVKAIQDEVASVVIERSPPFLPPLLL